MDGLQRAIDVIAAAEIRDGLLWHQGRPLTGEDLVLAVESRLLELGCTTSDSICCGGPDSADPHRRTSDVIRAGLPIVLDIFPFHKTTRYWGDMTRTVVRGAPPAEVEAMWEAVLEAQQAGLDAVRPGANGRDVHYACCDVFARRGYGSLAKPYRHIESEARFIHGTGHGLGLEIHEYPRVGDVDVTLEVGDVVTVEPGLYHPGLGGIRIEDLVVVTEDGFRNLTTLEKRFHLD
jgi:Xaa-Pro aminopeptidase